MSKYNYLDLDIEESIPETKAELLAKYLENLTFEYGHPLIKQISELMFNDVLKDHSCCDTETWQFNDELYELILRAPDNAPN